MNKGFIAIATVLVIMSVIVAVIATVTLLSVGEAQSSLAITLGEDNLGLVEGCVEDAMLKVRSDTFYAGGTISRPEGQCTIQKNTGNPNWDLTVFASSGNYYRKIQVKFTRNPTGIVLTSWKEII